MRLAIMQPYFFPYVGHFSLIAACDEWIVFDVSQYTPRSWINRNRVLHPAGGCKWLTLPLRNSSIHIRTHEAMLLDPEAARLSLAGHLSHYRRAPHYSAVLALIDRVFADGDTSLTRLNARALSEVCAYIGLPFRFRVCSELGLDLPTGLGPGDWAPEICAALHASAYVNPVGGRALFDPATFARRGVALHFAQARSFTYRSGTFAFEPDLSILDALMWNTPETVLAGVRNYTVQRADQLVSA